MVQEQEELVFYTIRGQPKIAKVANAHATMAAATERVSHIIQSYIQSESKPSFCNFVLY